MVEPESIATSDNSSKTLLEFLKAISPSRQPLAWSIVNAILLVWSGLLLLVMPGTLKGFDRLIGTRLYLTWDFGTTIVWCAETALTGIAADKIDIYFVIEITMAIYFTLASIYQFHKWFHADKDVESEVFEALTNTISYLYLFVRHGPWIHFIKSRNGGYEQIR